MYVNYLPLDADTCQMRVQLSFCSVSYRRSFYTANVSFPLTIQLQLYRL